MKRGVWKRCSGRLLVFTYLIDGCRNSLDLARLKKSTLNSSLNEGRKSVGVSSLAWIIAVWGTGCKVVKWLQLLSALFQPIVASRDGKRIGPLHFCLANRIIVCGKKLASWNYRNFISLTCSRTVCTYTHTRFSSASRAGFLCHACNPPIPPPTHIKPASSLAPGLIRTRTDANNQQRIEATMSDQQTPKQRDMVRKLHPNAISQWWQQDHPCWAIFPADSDHW